MQKSNALNKFYFYSNFFSYHLIPNLKKLCDSNKSRIFYREKECSQLYRFQFLKINSLMTETIKNQFSKTRFL